ncbi:hypothetical protein GCM10027047_17480 [Rhodococcus aerolatus]
MVVALLGAVLSALCYGSATVLQAVGARRTATLEDVAGLVRVLRQVPYLVGLGLDLLGFLFSLAALHRLPLFVVEPVVAGAVAVTALLAVPVLGARLTGREQLAVLAVVIGLALLGASGRPGRADRPPELLRWALVVAAVAGVVAALPALRRGARSAAAVLGALSGWEFGVVGVAARVLPDRVDLRLLADPALWALVVGGVAGIVLLTVAVQRGSVTTAVAAQVVVETAAPALVGIVLLGDTTRRGLAPLAVAGFVLAVGAALALSRFGDLEPDGAAAPQPG